MAKEMLSSHLSVTEYTESPTATRLNISNEMTDEHKLNAVALAVNVFEKIREFRKAPITVNSGYRSLALNKKIGGSKTSQHMRGEAIDLPLTKDEFDFIKENIVFDQLIWEFGDDDKPQWVHVSYTTHRKNKKQVLKSVKQKDKKTGKIKTVYLPM